MQSIYAHPGVHLALGRKGENVARQVVFDLRAWRAAGGDLRRGRHEHCKRCDQD